MSPYSANRSVRSSSEASSCMFVAITIQPSILRTATAFVEVRASEPALDLVSLGEAAPFSGPVGGTESTSISIDMMGESWRERGLERAVNLNELGREDARFLCLRLRC